MFQGPLEQSYIDRVTSRETAQDRLIKEMSEVDMKDIKDPNIPYVNHWADKDKIGFNRNLKPRQIHECFKDNDGQSKVFEPESATHDFQYFSSSSGRIQK